MNAKILLTFQDVVDICEWQLERYKEAHKIEFDILDELQRNTYLIRSIMISPFGNNRLYITRRDASDDNVYIGFAQSNLDFNHETFDILITKNRPFIIISSESIKFEYNLDLFGLFSEEQFVLDLFHNLLEVNRHKLLDPRKDNNDGTRETSENEITV